MSYEHPPLPAIPIEKLEPGVRYRIHDKKGIRPPYIGIFVRIVESNLFGTIKKHAIFNDTIKPNNIKPHVSTTTISFSENEWTFHQSGEQLMLRQVLERAVGLPRSNASILAGRIGLGPINTRKKGGSKTRRRRAKISKTRQRRIKRSKTRRS